MRILLLLPVLVAGVSGLTVYLSRGRRTPRQQAMREHADLVGKAAKASKRGQHGLAEIYMQAADNVLKSSTDP